MLVVGAITYGQASKIESEIKLEKGDEIKEALAKTAKKRRNIAIILFVLGGILILASMILLVTI